MTFEPYDPARPTPVSNLWMLGWTSLRTEALPTEQEVDALNRGAAESSWMLGAIIRDCKGRVLQFAETTLGLGRIDLQTAHALNPRTGSTLGELGWHYDNSSPDVVGAVCTIGPEGCPGTVFDKDVAYEGRPGVLYLMAGLLHSVPPEGHKYDRLLLRWYFPEFVTAQWVKQRLG